MLFNIIRKPKSVYYQKKFTDVRNNSVFTWKVINSLLRGGIKPSKFKLNFNNTTISYPKLVSEAFNGHINSIASKLAKEIPRVCRCRPFVLCDI